MEFEIAGSDRISARPDVSPAGKSSRDSSVAVKYQFENQTVIVTGANSGIGKATALKFGEMGANVVVNYVTDPAAADEVAQAIENSGGQAIAVMADVSREDQVQAMYKRTREKFGTIQVLVSNAGLQRDSAFEKMTMAQWQKVIDVNLTGQFLTAREAVREFKRRGMQPELSKSLGKIVMMSSVHQQIPWSGHANYASSKGGVEMLMQTLAQEVASHKIRVNSIAPGAIRTPINTSAWSTPEAYADLMRLVPYQRIGEPEDVARAALWLASDESDYVTGITLFVDGGMSLYPGFDKGG